MADRTCGDCRELIRPACRCEEHLRICTEQQRGETAEGELAEAKGNLDIELLAVKVWKRGAQTWQVRAEATEDVLKDWANASLDVGGWLSAALEDPKVCGEMKAHIRAWFDAVPPSVLYKLTHPTPTDEPPTVGKEE